MIKWMLFLTGLGVFILSFEWPFPRTYFDHLMIFFGYLLMLGPGFFLFALILNRVANISFSTNYRRKK